MDTGLAHYLLLSPFGLCLLPHCYVGCFVSYYDREEGAKCRHHEDQEEHDQLHVEEEGEEAGVPVSVAVHEDPNWVPLQYYDVFDNHLTDHRAGYQLKI